MTNNVINRIDIIQTICITLTNEDKIYFDENDIKQMKAIIRNFH